MTIRAGKTAARSLRPVTTKPASNSGSVLQGQAPAGGPTPNKPSTAGAANPRPVPTKNASNSGSVLRGQGSPDPGGTPNKPSVSVPPPLPGMGG